MPPMTEGIITRHMARKQREQRRLAWLRLNAYGLLVAGLCISQGFRIFDAEHESEIAQITGAVPPMFYVWCIVLFIAGIMMIYSFTSANTLHELLALTLVVSALVVRAITTVAILGLGDRLTDIRLATLLFAAGCCALRVTALMSRRGLAVTIPGARVTAAENRATQHIRAGLKDDA